MYLLVQQMNQNLRVLQMLLTRTTLLEIGTTVQCFEIGALLAIDQGHLVLLKQEAFLLAERSGYRVAVPATRYRYPVPLPGTRYPYPRFPPCLHHLYRA